MRLALALALGGLLLNVWSLWKPAPRTVHARPRCTLRSVATRPLR